MVFVGPRFGGLGMTVWDSGFGGFGFWGVGLLIPSLRLEV